VKRGTRPLSHEDIEQHALAVLAAECPEVLRYPQATPLDRIVEANVRRGELLYREDIDLRAESGDLGKCAVLEQPPIIWVDCNHRGEVGFPFTLAHELGHFCIQRGLEILRPAVAMAPFRDPATGRKVLTVDSEWAEWQANRFASALLMPWRPVMGSLSAALHRRFGLLGQLQIHLNAGPGSLSDYLSILALIAHRFGVSTSVCEYRLKDLGLLVDHRDESMRHMSELVADRAPTRIGLPELRRVLETAQVLRRKPAV